MRWQNSRFRRGLFVHMSIMPKATLAAAALETAACPSLAFGRDSVGSLKSSQEKLSRNFSPPYSGLIELGPEQGILAGVC